MLSVGKIPFCQREKCLFVGDSSAAYRWRLNETSMRICPMKIPALGMPRREKVDSARSSKAVLAENPNSGVAKRWSSKVE